MNYTKTRLERAVEELYTELEVHDPFFSIEEVAIKLDVDLLYCNNVSFSAEGHITLNPLLPENKMKEVFAHELCHAIYHSGTQLSMPKLFRELQENDAHNFALQFCVPTFMLRKMKLPNDLNTAVCFVSDQFGVTNAFASQRIDKYINRLEESLSRNFFTEMIRIQDKRRLALSR